MSKYEPLNDFLYENHQKRLRLTFAEIEGILQRPLPESARVHAAWWANNPTGHSHCRAWYEAGWRTENLDLAGQTVEFVRRRAVEKVTPKGASPWGALAGTVTIHDAGALISPSGADWDAEAGKL